ncbi:MAG: NADH-quinone oxidoreductase subunit C, partial [Plesiomonas sp.]
MTTTLQTPEQSTQGWPSSDHQHDPILAELATRFGSDAFVLQPTKMGMPVIWLRKPLLTDVLVFLKKVAKPYVMLYDLHGVDERLRTHREHIAAQDFTVFYHLLSVERNRDILIKI